MLSKIDQAVLQGLRDINDEYNDALDRSPYDISPCMECGKLVVCLPDGMPMCDPCGEKLKEQDGA